MVPCERRRRQKRAWAQQRVAGGRPILAKYPHLPFVRSQTVLRDHPAFNGDALDYSVRSSVCVCSSCLSPDRRLCRRCLPTHQHHHHCYRRRRPRCHFRFRFRFRSRRPPFVLFCLFVAGCQRCNAFLPPDTFLSLRLSLLSCMKTNACFCYSSLFFFAWAYYFPASLLSFHSC